MSLLCQRCGRRLSKVHNAVVSVTRFIDGQAVGMHKQCGEAYDRERPPTARAAPVFERVDSDYQVAMLENEPNPHRPLNFHKGETR
jgi:hypothetical protein